MPLSKEHKRQTRERIVRTASRAFRAGGVERTGIADLMQQAGLTHGGFYAHFPSKDALVAEACAAGLEESSETLLAVAAKAPPGEELRAIIVNYLSPRHRDAPATGCVVAALAAELSHEPVAVRARFTAALDTYFARLERYLPGIDEHARRDHLRVLFSGMAGALALARAVTDQQESDRILAAAREFYTRAFTGAGNLGDPRTERRMDADEQ